MKNKKKVALGLTAISAVATTILAVKNKDKIKNVAIKTAKKVKEKTE